MTKPTGGRGSTECDRGRSFDWFCGLGIFCKGAAPAIPRVAIQSFGALFSVRFPETDDRFFIQTARERTFSINAQAIVWRAAHLPLSHYRSSHRSYFTDDQLADLIIRLVAHLEKVTPLTPFQHATQNIVCPLLQDGRCSVYSVRPHSCRRHHSQDLQRANSPLTTPPILIPQRPMMANCSAPSRKQCMRTLRRMPSLGLITRSSTRCVETRCGASGEIATPEGSGPG